MPYATVASLPPNVKSKYNAAGQRAFLAAFNEAVYRDGKSDADATAIAHAAAARAAGKGMPVKPRNKTKAAKAFGAKKAARKAAKAKSSPIVDAMTY